MCSVVIVCVRTELVNAEDQDRLVDLESQNLGLDEGKRLSVDLDETLSGLQHPRVSIFCVSVLRIRFG